MPREDPRHECSRCKSNFPPENDGSLPWKREDGTWCRDCPWPDLEEAVETLTEYREMKALGDPAKTGRVPWLTAPYREAVRLCLVVLDG